MRCSSEANVSSLALPYARFLPVLFELDSMAINDDGSDSTSPSESPVRSITSPPSPSGDAINELDRSTSDDSSVASFNGHQNIVIFQSIREISSLISFMMTMPLAIEFCLSFLQGFVFDSATLQFFHTWF